MGLYNIADWRLGSPKNRFVSYSLLSSPISSITIVGTVSVDSILTANLVGSGQVKWQRGDTLGGGGTYADIGGATNTTYTVVTADIGYSIRCVNADATIISNELSYNSVTDLPFTTVGVSTIGLGLADADTTVQFWSSSFGGINVVLNAPAATNRPAYTGSAVPIVDFDGVDNSLFGPMTKGSAFSTYEFGAVMQRKALSANGDIWIAYVTGSVGFSLEDINAAQVKFDLTTFSILSTDTDPDTEFTHWSADAEPNTENIRVTGTINVTGSGAPPSRPDGANVWLGGSNVGGIASNIKVNAWYMGPKLANSQRTNLRALLTNYTGIAC